MHANDDDVWITGVGLATPMGCTFRDFGDRLLAGQSGIRAITTFDTTNHACKIGGFLDPLPCPPDWDANHFARCTPWEKLLLVCSVYALRDAGWWDRRSDVRIGLVVGAGAEWLVNWENDMQQGGNRLRQPDADG